MTNQENAAYARVSWQRFSKEITGDLARAIVSAFALVAVADGDLAESEVDSFVRLIYDNEDIQAALDFKRYEPLFRDISGAILSDPEAGKQKALELISTVKGDSDHCQLVESAAQIALMADDRERESETRVLELIRSALNSQ